MVEIGFGALTLGQLRLLLFEEAEIKLSSETQQRVRASFHFLEAFSKDKIIYGINTGFGPMAQHRIMPEDQVQLQLNLIRSHASGMGSPLEPIYTKAAMIARLNTLCLGYSGIHESAIDILLALIKGNVHPEIPEHGGVGASGDLVQLAHLALVMIGEGKAVYKDELKPSSEVFEILGLSPMQIKIREGLALMNGTSVMTGIGIVNAIYAERALAWAVQASLFICEMVGAYDDYFSPELNGTKKHRGQQRIASTIFKNFQSSRYVQKREKQLYQNLDNSLKISDKVQEFYSIRCVPQILGIILETVEECQELLVEEINSANDNPIVHVEAQNVFHGGNFHGDYVAFEMDKLKIAVTKLTMLAERQINFLMNPALNGILPPFANLGRLGFNFGMQGAQFTAVSTTAENQVLSTPMYVHSIPNNNDNQDIVSMGANAALMAKKVIDNAFQVLAIEMVSIAQAVDLLKIEQGLSAKSRQNYEAIRRFVPSFRGDVSISGQLEGLKEYMMLSSPLEIEHGAHPRQ